MFGFGKTTTEGSVSSKIADHYSIIKHAEGSLLAADAAHTHIASRFKELEQASSRAHGISNDLRERGLALLGTL